MLSMYFVTFEIFRLNLHVFRIYGQVIMAISPLYYSFYRCITLTLFFQIEFDFPGLLKQLALGDLCYQKYLWNKNFNCYMLYSILCNFIEYETINRTLMLVHGSFQFIGNLKALHIHGYWYSERQMLWIPMCKWENIQPHSPHPPKKYLLKNLQKLIHFNGDNLFR